MSGEMRSEDWDGHYWNVRLDGWRSGYTLMCADPLCLDAVEIVKDVLGRWYACHKTWDYRDPGSASSASSPRFQHWQEAARWAFDRGLPSMRAAS